VVVPLFRFQFSVFRVSVFFANGRSRRGDSFPLSAFSPQLLNLFVPRSTPSLTDRQLTDNRVLSRWCPVARAAAVWIIRAAPEFLARVYAASRPAFYHLRIASRAMRNNGREANVRICVVSSRLPTGSGRTD
jgi:hypothetical protein